MTLVQVVVSGLLLGAVYALFAVYIAKNFFPGGNETIELVKALLAFGLGFLIRPLGAILIGIYADKAGRKAALFLTIMIMAAGTLLIAIAPTYAAIGIGASIIGVAVGFGAQSLVKDFISGVFMLIEDQYGVGDVTDLGDATGTVESVGLRVTRLRECV